MSSPLPPPWSTAIDAWEAWARGPAEQAATTVYTRRQHLQRTARSLGVPDPWSVTGVELRAWFERQPWARETRRGYRSTLRNFYAWASTEGHVSASPADALPRARPGAPNPLPVPDVVYRTSLMVAEPRERLMMRLAAEHGLRRGEIAVVHSRDLLPDLMGWTLRVHGKGGKERLVPLLDDVAAWLRGLPVGYAFPGDDGGHLSPRWTGKLVNRLLPGTWTIHKLRHRAATEWWEASDHDLFVVQDLLGHASPVTTRLYVKVRDDRRRDTVRRAAAA